MAISLRDRGVRPLLIERADHVGASWRGRYDRLKLNTGRPFSHLPKPRPGKDGYPGKLVHSADYRNPTPYVGKRALVVGAGSSGMEIAHDLATGGAAKVWMAVRTPPNILLAAVRAGYPPTSSRRRSITCRRGFPTRSFDSPGDGPSGTSRRSDCPFPPRGHFRAWPGSASLRPSWTWRSSMPCGTDPSKSSAP
jgi:cation diffusion facilitator CzcD-associated flavoprotein CzcO